MPSDEVLAWTREQHNRIQAVLADLEQVEPPDLRRLHAGTDCWRVHAGCLAARIRATLTGEDHPQ